MKKPGLIFFISMLFCFTVSAQFTITGIVSDGKSGEKLPGASISIDKPEFVTVTTSKGVFQIKNLKEGNYRLSVSFVGYQAYIQDIKLIKDITLEIKLNPGVLLKETVVINATRVPVNAPSTVSYVKKEEISMKNNGYDLPYILSGIPSAVITSDAGTGIGYTGIRIRGTDMTRINVTVNGIPYNDPESHEVYWVDMPDIASSIDNIEIQRGVGTSSNGASSFGGSINIQTEKTRTNPYAEVDASGGSFNSIRTAINTGTGLLKDKFAVDLRLSRISSDGYIDRATANLKSFFVSGTYLGKKSFLKLNVFSGKERTYQAWDGVPGEVLDTNRTFNVNGLYLDSLGNIQYYKNEVDDYQQDNYQLIYNLELPNKLNLNTALHYTHGEGYYEQYEQDADPAYFGLTTSSESLLSTDLITRKWLKNDFYGITWSLTKDIKNLSIALGGAWNQYLGDHYGKLIWSKDKFYQQTFDYQWYTNQGNKQDANIFAKAMWTINSKFGLLADIQYRVINYTIDGKDDDGRDLGQNNKYQFINPKTGINYSINDRSKLHLYAGIANREPSRTNFKDADPGVEPLAEKLINFELGYETKYGPYQAGINIYYMDYKDQLVLTGKINNVGAPIMVNVPSSYRQGIELSGNIDIFHLIDWGCNITLSQNKIREFTEYVDDWDNGTQISNKLSNTDLSFSPTFTANNNITFKGINNLKISLLTKFVGKQYIDNTSSNDRRLNPYLVNDFRFTYSLKHQNKIGFEFSLLVNNILNEMYESNAWVYKYYYNGTYSKMDGYFPQATRNFMAGMKIKF